jgi:respiratory burst oxidase
MEGWPEVEKRFQRLIVNWFLLRSRFGQCIGELMSSTLLCCVFRFF